MPAVLRVLAQAYTLLAAVRATDASVRSVQQSWASQWAGAFDGSSGGANPVQRVVQLLKEMKDQLSKEADQDATAHDKAVCWCETNEKAKTKAVADSDAKITELLMEVESRGARSGELAVTVEQLKKELDEKKQSLATATDIREKDAAAFSKDEKESVQAITMLSNALVVLGKHSAGLLQITPAVQESLSSALGWVALKHEELQDIVSERSSLRGAPRAGASARRRPAAALLTVANAGASSAETSVLRVIASAASGAAVSQLPTNFAARVLATAAGSAASFAQQPTGAKSYSPQSGEILGVLKQLKEDFESHLSEAQKAELKDVEDYQQLKAALDQEIAASTARLDEMEGEAAANGQALSLAKRTLEATRETRSADVQFLQDLRLQCKDIESEYDSRRKARNDEILAVNDALVILTEDESRDLIHKTLGAGSFFQLDLTGTTHRAARGRAAELLLQAAGQLRRAAQAPDELQVWRASEQTPHSQLAAIAVQVQLDAFVKVKEAIDGMVSDLKAQQQQEVNHKALCTEQLSSNEKETYSKNQMLIEVQDRIGALQGTIEKLSADIDAARGEIARMQVEVKAAGEVREKENKNFQEQVTDQRAMQNILKKAVARLQQVFGQAPALLQEDPAPPAPKAPRKQHRGGGSVIALIEEIIKDSATAEHEAVAAEQEAQKVYETFVKNSNDSIKKLSDAIVSSENARAAAQADKSEAEAAEKTTQGQLQALAEYAADLHTECDFVLKNFDIRQQARLQEIEALQHAKAVLSGMTE